MPYLVLQVNFLPFFSFFSLYVNVTSVFHNYGNKLILKSQKAYSSHMYQFYGNKLFVIFKAR